jgi:hypothetical protein
MLRLHFQNWIETMTVKTEPNNEKRIRLMSNNNIRQKIIFLKTLSSLSPLSLSSLSLLSLSPSSLSSICVLKIVCISFQCLIQKRCVNEKLNLK